ncbi:hypothetical protein FDT66_11870 [Polaribacter aestuariivivens]|uniref:Lipoprotein n=1 Tax=Polaribacter aestuariivivens TaxID=2304626 RepID=A0A5S3N171_9FLAO|nr:hypothetical protein [Polaribacter aestuariivivens]TMM29078.1 hypothetical protein FDT66_11870 [Polaribacter aestuariivivens]
MKNYIILIFLVFTFSCKQTGKETTSTALPKVKEVEQKETLKPIYEKEYQTNNYTFHIKAINGEVTKLHIYTKGLENNFDETFEIEGQVLSSAELDINNDNFKEYYLKILPTDDSGNIDLMGFASHKNKSIYKIEVNESNHLREVNTDKISFSDNKIERSFTSDGKENGYSYNLIYIEEINKYILENIFKDEDSKYMDFTENDELAKKIATFFKEDYLKSDVNILTENDRKFQLAEVDLNNDGKKEIFINFITPYFCGSGGCNMLLLDANFKIITKFSVMQTPLFLQKETTNNWKNMLIRSGESFRQLVYKNGKYPSNPSVVKKYPYSPSGHDWVLFDEQFSPSKTYTF